MYVNKLRHEHIVTNLLRYFVYFNIRIICISRKFCKMKNKFLLIYFTKNIIQISKNSPLPIYKLSMKYYELVILFTPAVLACIRKW